MLFSNTIRVDHLGGRGELGRGEPPAPPLPLSFLPGGKGQDQTPALNKISAVIIAKCHYDQIWSAFWKIFIKKNGDPETKWRPKKTKWRLKKIKK